MYNEYSKPEKDERKSPDKLTGSGENPLIFDGIKKAKPTEEEERKVARNANARAEIEALKEKMLAGTLTREEKETFLESLRVLAPKLENDTRADLETFLTSEDPDKRIQAKQRLEEHAETNISLSLVSDWSHAMPSRPWLLPGWIAQGRITMLAGEGGRGKSWLLLQLAYGIATGNPIWIDKASIRSGENIESAFDNRPSLNIAKMLRARSFSLPGKMNRMKSKTAWKRPC